MQTDRIVCRIIAGDSQYRPLELLDQRNPVEMETLEIRSTISGRFIHLDGPLSKLIDQSTKAGRRQCVYPFVTTYGDPHDRRHRNHGTFACRAGGLCRDHGNQLCPSAERYDAVAYPGTVSDDQG